MLTLAGKIAHEVIEIELVLRARQNAFDLLLRLDDTP